MILFFTMNYKDFFKKLDSFSQKTLILAIIVLLFEFLLPHSLLAEDYPFSSKLGPVNTQLQADKTLPSEIANKTPRMIRWVTVTAYSSTVDQCDDTPFIGASNKYVYDGMVAANFLPFGTKVKFPDVFGDKVFTVDDRMNVKYNSRMDIWMPAREQAKQFGARYLKVEIY